MERQPMSERREMGSDMFSPTLSESQRSNYDLYQGATALGVKPLSGNISHTSHDPTDLSKYNPFKINFL